MIDYIKEFLLSEELLPDLLRKMLLPIDSLESDLMIEITTSIELKNSTNECCHMVMASVPEKDKNSVWRMKDATAYGLVQFSTPCCDNKGDLADISYSLDGYEYLVASYGDGSFYTYNLAEKIWMTLGLSPRCIGNEHQEIVYDDLEKPMTEVAKGQISNEYYWRQRRNVIWKVRNDYLRDYLWRRGHLGVRSFYYKSYIKDSEEIRTLMRGKPHLRETPAEGWYDLDIREHVDGLLLIQVWATIIAILPEKFPE
ncbi:MAG: hypothetical protein JSR33_09295, partial [Proteobacteria bacterium]|nr:hypothetical protein [Pseudomonadota bacterium]